MAEVGWDDVTYLRKRTPKATEKRSQQAVNAAQRSGMEVETSKKFSAGQNKQHSSNANTARLDRETEELKHSHVGLDTARLIQQGRQAKNLTQKELATKINEKPQVVNDYEAGKAIPNNQVMSKLERTLGLKLRGKDRGKPLAPKK
ncbi:hypothetical protein CAPTEDRAFT_171839 [Capitella teleta]|uniref:HTH cro/C1-type domain-containing protein n=1 Tax=Capitella teleta TaxID=283909 RepID=R7T5H0_CAPTE|nr:hypothetical protein CAPTEDRAFT_21741 [Capitella teleta]ELU17823.1 hypothetical protein CAPTEDRAFT_171839 [Capitella teleta]|eukprot:ELT88475.1 hypothetical protein CAPTEDRAFT_21741 [Capitella teleta]